MIFTRTSSARGALALAAIGLAACSDRIPTRDAEIATSGLSRTRIDCVASVRAGELRCGGPSSTGRGNVILGGQGLNVRLASSGTSYDGQTATLQSSVTVQNLLAQAMGTPDGVAVTGVNVFFASGPIVQDGTGTVEVLADSAGTFTAAGQPYYHYPQIVAPGATSAAQTWRFSVPATVSSFTFTVYVETRLRAENAVLRLAPILWSPADSVAADADLNDVWSDGEGLVLAVGGRIDPMTAVDGALVARSADGGASWTATELPYSHLHAVWGGPGGEAWAVGGASIIHSTDGGVTWSSVAPATANTAIYTGVWGNSTGKVFVAGTELDAGTGRFKGVLLASADSGVTWSRTEIVDGTDQRFLQDLWGTSDTELWVAGLASIPSFSNLHPLVLHSTDAGVTWDTASVSDSLMTVPNAIWAAPGAGVYMSGGHSVPGGQSGVLLYSADGVTWTTEQTMPPTMNNEITGVWGTGPDNVYMVSGEGTVRQWNGAAWTNLSSGTSAILMGIFGTSARDVWAVGYDGTIVHGTR